MTPREFWRFIDGARKARKAEAERAVRLAWLNAAWQRADKLPSLDVVLGIQPAQTKPGRAKGLTPRAARAKMREAFAAFGVVEQEKG